MWGQFSQRLFLQAPAALPLAAFAKAVYFLDRIDVHLIPVVVRLRTLPSGIPYSGGHRDHILSFMWSVSGAGVLPGVIALMGALMIPNLALQSQDLALGARILDTDEPAICRFRVDADVCA